MKINQILFFAFVFCCFQPVNAQQFVQVTPLSPSLGESSGLLFLNGKIITHNDSGGDAALFEIDSLTGNFSRKVVIANAGNNDWEDITADSNYIYIGDIGNNAGDRTNLRIFRISQNDYWNTPNDTIFADTIRFAYADQTVFTYQPEATNYDCEALASIGDSLYLFTKNWVNAKTYIYVLPKQPGDYLVPKSDSIFVQGLITGADFHAPSNRLILCGYTQFPFVVEMNQPLANPFHQNSFVRYNLPNTALIQLEAIVAFADNQYYLTAETFQSIAVRLYRLSGKNGLNSISEISNVPQTLIQPNPSNGTFTLTIPNPSEDLGLRLFTALGQEIPCPFESNINSISFQLNLAKGYYFFTINRMGGIETIPFVID